MTKPYSADLRVRVVEAVDEGATRQEAAERFGVSVNSAVRWHQLWRHEGSIEAKPYGGSRSPLEDHAEEPAPTSSLTQDMLQHDRNPL